MFMKKPRKERKPLPDIKCGDSDCVNGFHIYKAKKKKAGKEYEGINCRECGDDSIDWPEFRKRDLSDIDKTFTALKKEHVRHVFWDLEIDKYLLEELFQKGIEQIEKDAENRLIKVVKKCGKEIFRDGTQTPLNKHNIILFAQHATASCCRKCIQIWHNIPYDKELDDNDIKYLKDLILLYVHNKVPNLYNKMQLNLFDILEENNN
jgi:hypothetical protein